MKSLPLLSLKTIVFTILIFSLNSKDISQAETISVFEGKTQTIQGNSGGFIDSKNCGFIASSANYTMSLKNRIDYLNLSVQTESGEPTLLVIEPGTGSQFCVLGDRSLGLKPEMSGVWEAGNYEIYIGERVKGSQNRFTLNISTNKN